MPSKRTVFFITLTALLAGSLSAQSLFRKPVKVLGDPDFIGTASNPTLLESAGPNVVEGRELSQPQGVAIDTSVSPPIVYIADTGNNRVLGFRYATQLVPGAQADVILGQINRFSNQAQGPSTGRSYGLSGPTGLAVDISGNLYVADSGNNRVVRFPKPFAQPAGVQQFFDIVIGQKVANANVSNNGGLTASTLSLSGNFRSGICIDSAGNLWVADVGNSRVLRFPAGSLTGNSPAADLVLGQADFFSNGNTTNRLSKTALSKPDAVSVSPAGIVYVADQLSRVLVFDNPPAAGATAIRILGIEQKPGTQLPSDRFLNGPTGLTATSTQVYIADTGDHRILTFGDPSTYAPEDTVQISPAPQSMIGQTAFGQGQSNHGSGEAAADSFNSPTDIAYFNNELFVADSGNNRIIVYDVSSGLPKQALRVIGQFDFTGSAINLIEGREFAFSSGLPSSAVLDTTVTPPRLYVADSANNRILGFNDFAKLRSGDKADIVIGQPDLFHNTANYPSTDPVLPTETGLRGPTGLALDTAGNLYVADAGNARVVRYAAPFASGKTALQTPDLVIGQSNLTSKITDPTGFTLGLAASVALTSEAANSQIPDKGYMIVADTTNNRVLLYAKPFVSGMSATKVLGQLNFTSNTAGSEQPQMSSPRGVAVDPQDRVLVADSGNRRVAVFDRANNLSNFAVPPFLLTANLSVPYSLTTLAGGQIWVADAAGALVRFPAVASLPQANYAADATLPLLGGRSVGVSADKFGNLLATDSASRVDYFAPPVVAQNAANYSTRFVSAGTIVALYPTAATTTAPAGIISSGTATAPAGIFPLPTTLSDTQVLVNGTAVPLFFTSPGQINAILPNKLPSGGFADLQVIRPSTGQIYGGGELSLAVASPGLFTLNASGSGQLAAINVQDGTINSATNPVARGQFISLYGTGLGQVTSWPADGQPGAGQQAIELPTVQITSGLGSSKPPAQATVTFSGLAPGFAGVWQVNVQIPPDAQLGSAVILQLYQNSTPNLDIGSTVTTTIAIK